MRRRDFVLGAALAGADSSLPSSSVRIDTHTHFYDPSRPQGVPWPRPSEKDLYRTVLPHHFREATRGLGDVRTVVVEASPWVEDNQWVLDLAKDEPVIVGFVGNLRPGSDDFRPNLKRFARNSLFRGIRVYLPDATKNLPGGKLVEELRALADLDLEVDFNGGAEMFPPLLRIAEKLPELRIVIEHLPYEWPKDGARRDEARAAFRELRDMPRVYAKISWFLEAVPGGRATLKSNGVEEVWEVFGAERVIYGSNWPLSDRFGSYREQMERIGAWVREKDPQAGVKFFRRNAERAYKVRVVKGST